MNGMFSENVVLITLFETLSRELPADIRLRSKIENLLNDLNNEVTNEDSLIEIKKKLDSIIKENSFNYYVFKSTYSPSELVRNALIHQIIESMKVKILRSFTFFMIDYSSTLHPGENANMSVVEVHKLLNIILQNHIA